MYTNYNRNKGNYNPDTYKPKTGCKIGEDKRGFFVMTGWNAASKRRGLIKFIATKRLKDGKEVKPVRSKSNRYWQPMSVKITFADSLDIKWVSGLYEEATKTLLMNEIDMVARANVGRRKQGYWGRNFVRKQ